MQSQTTSRCAACGKPTTPAEAFQQIEVGSEVYLVCCQMCLDALEAGRVQRKMIPSSFSEERIEVLVEYLPALQIGGDYAYIQSVSDDKLHIVVADVSGHGITSSLVMNRMSTELDRLLAAGEQPANVAKSLNQWMNSNLKSRRLYTTLFHAVISYSECTLTYLSCGHATQLLWSADHHRFVRLESQTIPIGLFGNDVFDSPSPATVKLCPGDKLVLFTDGLPDIEEPDGSDFGENGITEMLLHRGAPTVQSARDLIDHVRGLGQESRADDLLFLFVDFKG